MAVNLPLLLSINGISSSYWTPRAVGNTVVVEIRGEDYERLNDTNEHARDTNFGLNDLAGARRV